MSIITLFLNNTITSISSTTSDAYNDKTPTVVYSNVKCRWEEVFIEEAKPAGITKEFQIRCWILPSYVIKSGYQVVYEGRIFEVVGLEKYTNIDGQHDHTMMYLGAVR